MTEAASTTKPKRARKPKPPRPLTVISAMGEKLTFNDPEKLFEEKLRDSEDDVVRSLKALLQCQDATAAVTAATKIFAHLEDKETPGRLREKLQALRDDAFELLKEVSEGNGKPTAQAQANACLLKVMVQKAPAIWPPNTEEQSWKERMAKAESLASV